MLLVPSGVPSGRSSYRKSHRHHGALDAACVILPADGPRTAPTAHRKTKPQMPCSDEFRSASLSYRPTLADRVFCDPIAPAHSCRAGRPLIPPTSSPTTTVGAAPPFPRPFPLTPRYLCKHAGRLLYAIALCALSHSIQQKGEKVCWTAYASSSDED